MGPRSRKSPKVLPSLIVFSAGMLFASAARAQFVPLSRCRTAFPCSIPFDVQYRPDPLIAGQYGGEGNTGVVAAMPLSPKVTIHIEPRRSKEFPLAPEFAAALEAASHKRASQPIQPEASSPGSRSPAPAAKSPATDSSSNPPAPAKVPPPPEVVPH